jgi:hypothetical protein
MGIIHTVQVVIINIANCGVSFAFYMISFESRRVISWSQDRTVGAQQTTSISVCRLTVGSHNRSVFRNLSILGTYACVYVYLELSVDFFQHFCHVERCFFKAGCAVRT